MKQADMENGLMSKLRKKFLFVYIYMGAIVLLALFLYYNAYENIAVIILILGYGGWGFIQAYFMFRYRTVFLFGTPSQMSRWGAIFSGMVMVFLGLFMIGLAFYVKNLLS